MRRYGRLEAEFTAAGRVCRRVRGRADRQRPRPRRAGPGQPLGTLSGGQRRRVELARILFSGAETLLLDEPTNHLDADSIVWLRDYLKAYKGGLIVITHDAELLDAVVNKVFHLDANRGELDLYNVGWKTYLQQRETDEKRRKRERANAEKKAGALHGAGRQDARQGHQGRRRPEHGHAAPSGCSPASRASASHDKVAKLRFPKPAACGKTPLRASGLSSSYGSLEVFTDVDLAIDRGCGRRARPQRRRQDDAAADARRRRHPRHRRGRARSRAAPRLLRPGAREPRRRPHGPREHEVGRARPRRDRGAQGARLVPLLAATTCTSPPGVLSGGEKTRLSLALLVVSAANVLLLDEPTNNLDPASREEILGALRTYEGAVVLVTHDEGAVEALEPERILLLPDGVEDLWSPDYLDLVDLA